MGGKHSKSHKKDKNKNKWVPQPVNPSKYHIQAEKNYLYVDLFVKKKMSEIQAKEADLERVMKLPVRYRDDEVIRARSLVNDHKYVRAARIILKDCGVLRDLTHEVIAVKGDLGRLPNLLPYIETVVWGARRLNLHQLKDLEQMLLETLGPDVLSKIDESPNIDQELRGLFANDKPTPNELNDYWNMFSVQHRMPIDVINKAGHGVNTFTQVDTSAVPIVVAAPLVPIEPMKPRVETHYSAEPSREKFLFGGLNAAPPQVQRRVENIPISPPTHPNVKVPAIAVTAPGRGLQSPGKRDTGLTVEQPLSPFTLSTILRRADKLLQSNNVNTNDYNIPDPQQFLTAPGRMSTQKDSMSIYPQQQFVSSGRESSNLPTPPRQLAKGNNQEITAAHIQALEKERSKYTEQTVFVQEATIKRTVEREIECHTANAPLMAIPSWLDLTLQPYNPETEMMKSSIPIQPPMQTKFSTESMGSFIQEKGYQPPEPVKHAVVDALDNLVDSMAFTTGGTQA